MLRGATVTCLNLTHSNYNFFDKDFRAGKPLAQQYVVVFGRTARRGGSRAEPFAPDNTK